MSGARAMLAELRRLADAGERIATAVEGLRTGLAGRNAGPTVDDATRTEALCAAINAAIGDAPFVVRDLLDDAKADPVLRLALAAFVDPSAPGAAKSLGKCLAARAGRRFGRHYIESDPVSSTSAGRAWIVRRV